MYVLLIWLLVLSQPLIAACPFQALYDKKQPQGKPTLLASLPNWVNSIFDWCIWEPNLSVPIVKADQDIGELGPDRFFYALAEKSKAPLTKVRMGPKWIYVVSDATLAEKLLQEHGENLGRGGAFESFKHMVGDVFFAHDGPEVKAGRDRFRKSVIRESLNFDRITDVWSQIIPQDASQEFDLYVLVFRYVLGGIGKCFVGIDNIDTIPKDAHLTFIEAARQITRSATDPLSRLMGPKIRSDFRETAQKMANMSQDLLQKNKDSILQGHNYVWDLAAERGNNIHDLWVREHGPMTLFASMNVGRSLFYVLDILSQRPDIAEKIRRELKEVIGGETFGAQHLYLLTYTRAVISEALWHLTPIPVFPREVLSDFKMSFGSDTIDWRQGDMIMLLFRSIQGTPTQFLPERWLPGYQGSAPSLWAFSKGHRKCPAQPFAFQLIDQFIVNMFLSGMQLVPTDEVHYTTRLGGLGPDYDPEHPILGKVVTFEK